MRQRTIKKKVQFTGIGLHSGKFTEIICYPEDENFGIKFKLQGKIVDLKDFSFNSDFNTSLVFNGFKIKTVEHFFSAIYAIGLSNLLIEPLGEEFPIYEGNSIYYLMKFKNIGIKEQNSFKEILTVKKKIKVSISEDIWAEILPSPDFEIIYNFDFPYKYFKNQVFKYKFSENNYEKEIAWARTFSFKSMIKKMYVNELIKGGKLYNAILFDDKGLVNPPIYDESEYIRHKVLDAIGDLALLNKEIKGKFIINKGGHRLHLKVVEKLKNL